MTTELPDFAMVGPMRYSIRVDDAAVDKYAVAKKVDYAAYSDHESCEIFLRGGFSIYGQRESVMHELLHCVMHVTGFWYHTENDKVNGEEICQSLSNPLIAVLRDNPHITAWLTAVENEQ